MASSVKYNVGTFEGLNGTAIVYIAETASGGTSFLVHKATVGGVDKFVFMSRSSVQSELLKSKLVLSSNVDVSKLAEEAPAGTLVDGYVDIDNGAALPKIAGGEGFYSLKGEGIADYKADIGTPVTGKEGGSGSTVVVTTAAKTISETMTEAVTWVTKNPLILVLILFALSELLGLTNVLGLKKKKGARARRR